MASNPTGMTARTQVAVDYVPDLTLRSDGLGPFDFGDPVDEVADGLIAILGPPTDDETVLTEEWEVYGFATDGYWRGMSWQELQLLVVFTGGVLGCPSRARTCGTLGWLPLVDRIGCQQ